MKQRVELDQIVYVVQGLEFALKPSSIKNREAASAHLSEIKKKVTEHIRQIRSNIKRERILALKKSAEEHGEKFDEEIPEEYDVVDIEPYDLLFEMFCAITDGPHDRLKRNEFDTRYAERARADFLPEGYKTNVTLEQFLLY